MIDDQITDNEEIEFVKRSRLRRFFAGLFAPWSNEVYQGADLWERDASRALVSQSPLRARAILYSIGFIVIVLIVWSAFAEVNEVTRGQGKVIPSRKVQIIQSQDGGVVTEILVREGDVVTKGQALFNLDQTRSRSTFRENRYEFLALAVKEARLRATIENTEFEPSPELRRDVPLIVDQEEALYTTVLAERDIQQEIALQKYEQANEELVENRALQRQLRRSLELTQKEMDLTKPMVGSGAVSTVEILRLEREVNQLVGELAQADSKGKRLESVKGEAQNQVRNIELEWINAMRDELASTISRMNALRELSEGLSDRVRQAEIRSPVTGTVKQLYFNTIGGVVLPGKEIIEIVPLDDTLLLEVHIHPRDIAFLVPGQRALVKFTAYDFIVYGGLEGVVEQISADTIIDLQGNPYYQVRVRTTELGLGTDMPIIPGMTVNVDILTGKKDILSYFLKPILKAKKNSMTER